MDSVLVAQELRKRYRGAQRKGRGDALGGVSLSIGRGEIVGLLGPNGAGKSTFAKIVCGLVRPTAGSALLDGHPVGSRAAQARLGYLAELFRYPPWATADGLLRTHQRLAGADGGASERGELLELVGLGDAAEVKVASMSKGMQQRLGLAQALVGRPPLVLLDEPTSALDPVGRAHVREVLKELRDRGQSVLLSSHLLPEVEQVADRVAIIARGRLIIEGRPTELAGTGGAEFDLASGIVRRPELRREDLPAEVARLVAAGEQVYGVRELRGTLEEAYLRAVEEHGGDGRPPAAPAGGDR
ncbi:MAG: ABC transporter ATP-binding protein [Solirubrobacteraceae bacterium]|nr:ABC transporter ATP-binding protein [Solirubrobacteraceae bacterium]